MSRMFIIGQILGKKLFRNFLKTKKIYSCFTWMIVFTYIKGININFKNKLFQERKVSKINTLKNIKKKKRKEN